MKKQILAPSILALFVASAAHAGATFDTPVGSLYLGGDVEFDYTSETDVNASAGGRLLVDIHGERVLENGNFVAFAVNPTFGQQGGTGVDDAWIKVGVKDNWAVQAGHFEAANLSPDGQDIYVPGVDVVEYDGNTARGRVGDEGAAQVTFTKAMGAAGLEVTVNSNPNDDSDAETNAGDVVFVRPVMTFAADALSVAVGAEIPVVDQDDTTEWVGMGATATMQASDDLSLTAKVTLKTGDDTFGDNAKGDIMTAGVGAQFQNFYADVTYIDNDQDGTESLSAVRSFVSYKIPAVMDIDNFDVYLGAGYTMADKSDNDVTGAKIRLKYIF